MRCEELQPLLDMRLDNELPEEIAQKVDRHLLRCPTCAYEIRTLEQTRAMGLRQNNKTFATILTAAGASAALNTRLINSNVTPSLSGRDTNHKSVYGLFEYDFTDRLTVGVEARYYKEDFEYDFPTSILVLGAGATPLPAPA